MVQILAARVARFGAGFPRFFDLFWKAFQERQHRVKVGTPSKRTNSRSQGRVKSSYSNAIETADCQERKRGRRPAGKIEFGHWLTEVHRSALVEQDVDSNVFFFDKLPEHQPFEAREDAPIDVPEVIAGFVLSEVSEFD